MVLIIIFFSDVELNEFTWYKDFEDSRQSHNSYVSHHYKLFHKMSSFTLVPRKGAAAVATNITESLGELFSSAHNSEAVPSPSTNATACSPVIVPRKSLEAFGLIPANSGGYSGVGKDGRSTARNAVDVLRSKFGNGPITITLPQPTSEERYVEEMLNYWLLSTPYKWLHGWHRCIRLRKKRLFRVRLSNNVLRLRYHAKKMVCLWL